MKQSFYLGNLSRDYDHPANPDFRGWIVGTFMKDIRQTNKVEIKFWRYAAGKKSDHAAKKQ